MSGMSSNPVGPTVRLTWYRSPLTASPLPSVAGQSVEALGGPASVIVRRRREHARLHELVQRVRAATGDEQDELLTQLCRLVFPHAVAEEAVLLPAAR